ncbi:hypothetical protein C8R44DRAFT_27114 [Mycena epipterygia]|nr:hypothetical protein C8R44DRAFT_27114 [Mycena epipterygia]
MLVTCRGRLDSRSGVHEIQSRNALICAQPRRHCITQTISYMPKGQTPAEPDVTLRLSDDFLKKLKKIPTLSDPATTDFDLTKLRREAGSLLSSVKLSVAFSRATNQTLKDLGISYGNLYIKPNSGASALANAIARDDTRVYDVDTLDILARQLQCIESRIAMMGEAPHRVVITTFLLFAAYIMRTLVDVDGAAEGVVMMLPEHFVGAALPTAAGPSVPHSGAVDYGVFRLPYSEFDIKRPVSAHNVEYYLRDSYLTPDVLFVEAKSENLYAAMPQAVTQAATACAFYEKQFMRCILCSATEWLFWVYDANRKSYYVPSQVFQYVPPRRGPDGEAAKVDLDACGAKEILGLIVVWMRDSNSPQSPELFTLPNMPS